MQLISLLLAPGYLLYPIGLVAASIIWARAPLPQSLSDLRTNETVLFLSAHWENFCYVSCFFLTVALYFTKIKFADREIVDTTVPKVLYIINALFATAFVWRHRLYFLSMNGFDISQFIKDATANPVKTLYLVDLSLLVISVSIYLYNNQRRTKQAISYVSFFGQFLGIALVSNSFTVALFFVSLKLSTEVRPQRGQKDYTLCYLYFGIAVVNAVIAFYIFRHYVVGVPFDKIISLQLSDQAFGNVASSSIAYDLYYFGSIVYIISIVDNVALNHLTFLPWILLYTKLSIMFGACVFNTIFFMQIEYLTQKYKNGEKMHYTDHGLFLLINAVLLAEVLGIGVFLPEQFLALKW